MTTVDFNSVPNNADFSASFIYASTGYITGTTKINGGSGYTDPIVNFNPPVSGLGRAASGVAELSSGSIDSITIVDPGEGYQFNEPLIVSISDPAGSGAVFSAATNASAVDLTGSTLSMMVREDPANTDVRLSIDSASIGGITITNPTGGAFDINIPRSSLQKLSAKTYVQDLIRLTPGGTHESMWSGKFTVIQGVTQ